MIKIVRFFQIAALIMLAAGAQPAISSVWQWSTTAATNATADPTINWAEGMSPSSVNDSARAMMAAIAKWNGDTSGVGQAIGTGSAMTYASQSVFTNLAALTGQRITFMNFAGVNSAGVTLNVDGIGAFPLVSSNGVPIAAGTMQIGGIYTVTFQGFDSSYHLWNFYQNDYNIPLGGLLYSTLPSPPNANFVVAAGQCLSTTTYAAYWTALGSPGTGGCAAGQFPLPLDARGRTLVGLDNLGGSAAGRLTSATPGCGTTMQSTGASCANGVQFRVLTLAQLPTGITAANLAAIALSVNSTPNDILRATAHDNFTSVAGDNGPIHQVTGNTIASSGNIAIGAAAVTSNNTNGDAHTTLDPNAAIYIYVRVL